MGHYYPQLNRNKFQAFGGVEDMSNNCKRRRSTGSAGVSKWTKNLRERRNGEPSSTQHAGKNRASLPSGALTGCSSDEDLSESEEEEEEELERRVFNKRPAVPSAQEELPGLEMGVQTDDVWR